MAKILVVGTHGTDDATRGSLPFITATGALRAGVEVAIALIGEAAYLTKPALAKGVHGVGYAPLTEYIDKVVQAKVPIYV